MTPESNLDELASLLEGPALTGNEARLLATIVRLGTAAPNQMARVSGISRSNLYPLLDSLRVKGLVERLPGKYAAWMSPGASEVLAKLRQVEEQRLSAEHAQVERRIEQASALLAGIEERRADDASIITVMDMTRSGTLYLEAMAAVSREILVWNRGPYPGDVDVAEPVLAALGRGVTARALYRATELADPALGDLRRTADEYAAAGVVQRVVDDLPISLAILDRSITFIGIPEPEGSDTSFRVAAVCRHEGLAQVQAVAFEEFWSRGVPYQAGNKDGRANADRQARKKSAGVRTERVN